MVATSLSPATVVAGLQTIGSDGVTITDGVTLTLSISNWGFAPEFAMMSMSVLSDAAVTVHVRVVKVWLLAVMAWS